MLFQRQSHIWLLNGMLALLVLIFCFKTLSIQTADDESVQQIFPDAKAASHLNLPPIKRPLPQRPSFNDIIEKNLFSKERAEIMPIRAAGRSKGSPENVASGLVLYGIVIEGQDKKALITNLEDKQSNGSIWVQPGERIGRYIVKDIQADNILITSGQTTYTLKMSDGSQKRNPSVGRRNQKPLKRPIQNMTGRPAKLSTDGKKAVKRFIPAPLNRTKKDKGQHNDK